MSINAFLIKSKFSFTFIIISNILQVLAIDLKYLTKKANQSGVIFRKELVLGAKDSLLLSERY